MASIEGFGFFYTDCIYEGCTSLQSFHKTKAGAYQAMRKRLVADWEEEFQLYVTSERNEWKRTTYLQAKQLWHTRYRVFPHSIEIQD